MTVSDDPAYDTDQAGQELDESLPAEFPPDEPMGLDEILDNGEDDEAQARDDEEEYFFDMLVEPDPDLDDIGEPQPDDRLETAAGGVPEDHVVADESVPDPDAAEAVAAIEGDAEVLPDDHGALSDDDEFTGDETTRDYATERVTPSAEEAALHIEEV
jgi:hypothetical protein